ncbi:putative Bardet-Biedl syndrome 5 [Danaus plexippus plexippus]|uniref:Bardet-Biedl syndrome 5 n=1 Tax=Danaus plexippus plexippus TaxID=278856 RepID=A0A212F450_DANPL|nr:Bardet-Biedl syndrome 5 protein homolog [Danaus plexippus plexippus]OWR48509.1 putative Bardet-Biedl syndrome 5 [Danaus plexippus plexippus]
MPKSKRGIVWEDREVLFDLPFSYLKLRTGEKVFDRIEPIEDTKGNSGMKGRLVVTNLRIIWHSLTSPRINLTVGLNCFMSTSTKVVNSGLRGTTQALYILAGYNTNKYEFVFTNLAPNCVRHYTSVSGVHKAYASSRMYRDLKLRGAFIHNKQLKVLPLEKICLTENGIWNLSSESGNLGTMVISNVRIVWYADINESFNVSMPYITIESITVRDSKFGDALVIATRPSCGGYVLGFRAERERLQPLLSELQTLHNAYTDAPVFGVEMCWESEISKPLHDDINELEEIGEPRGEMGPSLYLASQQSQHKDDADVQPVYSQYLGLAIEPLKEGFTLQNLFEVQTAS